MAVSGDPRPEPQRGEEPDQPSDVDRALGGYRTREGRDPRRPMARWWWAAGAGILVLLVLLLIVLALG